MNNKLQINNENDSPKKNPYIITFSLAVLY